MLLHEHAIFAVASTRSAVEVRDVMTADPMTLPSRASVNDALMLMRHQRIRHIPVIGDDGRLVGMVSDHDLLAFPVPALAGDGPLDPHRSPLDVTLDAVMSREVRTCRVDDALATAMKILVDERVGALPVLDGAGRLVGLLGTVDILNWLQARLAA